MSESGGDDGAVIGNRWPELGTAMVLFVAAILVIVDSVRVGIGWADDGPRSGYFPFYIGLGLLGSSGWIALKQVMAWRASAGQVFAERSQIVLVWAILWPMVVYVGLVATLGLYVASLVLIAYFMLRHGKHSVLLTASVAVGVPLVCFFVFERWFMVTLPKGPLEALIGL
jgi:hypothetical protein